MHSDTMKNASKILLCNNKIKNKFIVKIDKVGNESSVSSDVEYHCDSNEFNDKGSYAIKSMVKHALIR